MQIKAKNVLKGKEKRLLQMILLIRMTVQLFSRTSPFSNRYLEKHFIQIFTFCNIFKICFNKIILYNLKCISPHLLQQNKTRSTIWNSCLLCPLFLTRISKKSGEYGDENNSLTLYA